MIAGVTSAAGVRNAEIAKYKLGPLDKAGKLFILHNAAYDAERNALWETRLKSVPR